jgi:transcriptional regulator with XRE-family HTH domain
MDKNEQRMKMIGACIQNKRKATGYTQDMVSDHLKISTKSYSAYEQGKSVPDLMRLIQIAEFFKCRLDELVVGISPKPDDQAQYIASLLHGLKRADRLHIVKIVERIVLIAKDKAKVTSI